jgi:threonine dehydrogenase-like Zn-dependent dehydrogenase
MKVLYKNAVKTTIIEIEIPKINHPDEVLVRIKLGAICRTDVYVHQNIIPSNDVILGHECAGVIADKGVNVTHLSMGDLVSINPFLGCGTCEHCIRHNFQLCPDQQMMGKDVDGVFCEYVLINKNNVVKFAKTPMMNIAFFEPVLAMAAVLNTSIKKGEKILIYGDNRIAQLTKKIMVTNGFTAVDCFIPKNNQITYDYVIETVPDSFHFNAAVSMLRVGGNLILKSRIFNPLNVDLFAILKNNIKIESAYYYDNIEHVVEMIENELDFTDLIGDISKLNDYEEVFLHSLDRESRKLFLEV